MFFSPLLCTGSSEFKTVFCNIHCFTVSPFIRTDVLHSAALPVRVVPLNVAVKVDLSFSFSPPLLLVSPPLVLSPVPPESYIVSKLSSDDNPKISDNH